MPPKGSSDRGQDVAYAIKHATKRHISDIPGAKGCYYCWVGEYDKCEQACKKVHKVSTTQADVRPQMDADAFDHATPFLTKMFQQTTSVFDEIDEARDIALSFQRHIESRAQIEKDVCDGCAPSAARASSSSWDHRQAGGLHRVEANAALYDTRSPAARRHPELKSIHPPQPVVTRFKAPRGSTTIQVTPYTVVNVAPATHAYAAHHRAERESGDAVWTGRLVKEGVVANDPRSQAFAEKWRAGRAGTPPTSRSVSWRPGGVAADSRSYSIASTNTTPSSGTRHKKKYTMEQDHVASFIMSGAYSTALDLPLPPVFDPIARR